MFNKVILIGRLVADPELKQTPNGVAVAPFRIAVDRPYSKGSERQADFIDIVAWRNNAEFVSRYFSKGKLILVEGSLQVRNYVDKNDQKRTTYEVVADNCRFAESKGASQGGGNSARMPGDFDAPPRGIPSSTATNSPASAYSSGSVDDFVQIDDDGDLPF